MKIEKSKNAFRNMIFGWGQSIYSIVAPFVTRTLFVYLLGVQYLGLNSLFSSVLSVLNLAELGVGMAMVYSMYKPIAEDDKAKICALMKLYKIYYRIIGTVILGLGILIVPFLPKLIKGDVPADINIYVIYFLNLLATVLTYWLFAYKNCLLSAHQRNDISSKISVSISFVTTLLQIVILCIFKNYYAYLIVLVLSSVANNIVTAIIVSKKYPEYKPKGNLGLEEKKDINKRVRDLFTSKVGAVVVNSVDTIVISAFLGLKMLAVYQNYYYIMTSVCTFILVIYRSCTAGIGNSIVLESKEKVMSDFYKFLFIIVWISGCCSCCFLCLYQPFMRMWMGEKLMLDFSFVVCLVIYFFVMEINQLLNQYKDAAGLWHQDRFRPLVTAGANLTMNLVLVNYWGIYGVILSTVISTVLVGMPWLIHNLFTTLFERYQLRYFLCQLALYSGVVVVSNVLCLIITNLIHLELVLEIAIKLLVCIIVPNLVYFLAFYSKKEFKETVEMVDRMTNYKINLSRVFNKTSKN